MIRNFQKVGQDIILNKFLMFRNIFVLMSVLFLNSCQNGEEQLSLKTRKLLSENFNGNEFTKGRDNNHFRILYKLDSCRLSFSISKREGNYITEDQNYLGQCNFLRQEMEESLSYDAITKVRFLDSINIIGLTSKFINVGVLFKIYMKDGSAYILVGDTNKININTWKSYVNKSKELGEGWYYIKEDY